jgi:hypothetical protein
MASFIKYISLLLGLLMLYTTIETSIASNLLEEWPTLVAIPWMQATLIDFYINIAFIFLWVVYRERTLAAKTGWLVALVCLGSMATAAYVFLQARSLGEGDGLEKMFLPKHAS